MNGQIEAILNTAYSDYLRNINRAGLPLSNIQATIEACIDSLATTLVRTQNHYAVQDERFISAFTRLIPEHTRQDAIAELRIDIRERTGRSEALADLYELTNGRYELVLWKHRQLAQYLPEQPFERVRLAIQFLREFCRANEGTLDNMGFWADLYRMYPLDPIDRLREESLRHHGQQDTPDAELITRLAKENARAPNYMEHYRIFVAATGGNTAAAREQMQRIMTRLAEGPNEVTLAPVPEDNSSGIRRSLAVGMQRIGRAFRIPRHSDGGEVGSIVSYVRESTPETIIPLTAGPENSGAHMILNFSMPYELYQRYEMRHGSNFFGHVQFYIRHASGSNRLYRLDDVQGEADIMHMAYNYRAECTRVDGITPSPYVSEELNERELRSVAWEYRRADGLNRIGFAPRLLSVNDIPPEYTFTNCRFSGNTPNRQNIPRSEAVNKQPRSRVLTVEQLAHNKQMAELENHVCFFKFTAKTLNKKAKLGMSEEQIDHLGRAIPMCVIIPKGHVCGRDFNQGGIHDILLKAIFQKDRDFINKHVNMLSNAMKETFYGCIWSSSAELIAEASAEELEAYKKRYFARRRLELNE